MTSDEKHKRLDVTSSDDFTSTIGDHIASAHAAASAIGTFSDPTVGNIVNSLGVVMNSGGKFKRLDHVAASSGITLINTHDSTCDISAINAVISSARVLASMIGKAITSAMVNLIRPSQHAATDDPVTMILLRTPSTAWT